MRIEALRPAGFMLVALSALGAASCGSSSKPAAVATSSFAPTTTSTSTSTSTVPVTTTTTTGAGGTTTSTSPPLSNWTTPRSNPDGSIAVSTFNARLDAEKPSWASSPERIADEFLNRDTIDASTVATQITALTPQTADVVVNADGVRDDSVHAIRYQLHLVRQPDQSWRLGTAAWTQRCQPNRGHQDFSTSLCI